MSKITCIIPYILIYDVYMAKILLKEVMKKKSLKIEGIIKNVSLSRATVYRILSGEKDLTLSDLEQFAKELKVPLEDLYASEYSWESMRKKESQY